MIQFAKYCDYAVGVDLDTTKCNYSHQNASVYGLNETNFKVLHSDFLKLDTYGDVDFGFPLDGSQRFDAIFMSPPWGGTGYNRLPEYALEHIFPDFDAIIEKAVNYSSNLMLFLPRNTSISDLIARLLPHQSKLLGDARLADTSQTIGAKGD